MEFIDVHTHLCLPEFEKDIDEVIARSKDAGVRAIIVVSQNHTELPRITELMERYPDYLALGLGVHPVQGDYTETGRYSANMADLEAMRPHIEQHGDRLVCVGEVGLDFSPSFCPTPESRDNQRDVLRAQVELARQLDLPLNVHSRSAGRPTIHLLKELGVRNAVLHAFDGKPSVAMEGVEAGYYFSIPPSIVRSEQKQKLVRRIPLENMLLETDSPALGPEKQQRNEPKNVTISAEYIAKIKEIDVETVARKTFENALKLFPKLRRLVH